MSETGECFALLNGKCTVLTAWEECCKFGRPEKCLFYRTTAEKEESERKAKIRCAELKIPYGKGYAKSASK